MRGMNGSSFNIGPRQVEQLPAPHPRQLVPCDETSVSFYLQSKRFKDVLSNPHRLSILGKLLHIVQGNDFDVLLRIAEICVRQSLDKEFSEV